MTKYEWERELKKNIQRLPSDEIDRVISYYDELFGDKADSGMSESAIIREFGNPFDVAHKIINEFESASQSEGYKGGPDDVIIHNEKGGAGKFNIGETFKKFIKTKILQEEYTPPVSSVPADPWASQVKESTFEKSVETPLPKRTWGPAPEPELKSSSAPPANKQQYSGFIRFLFVLPFVILSIVLWSVSFSIFIAGIASVAGGVAGFAAGFIGLGLYAGLAQSGMGLIAAGIGLILAVIGFKLFKVCAVMTRVYFLGRKKERER